jgi:hypothetical protein
MWTCKQLSWWQFCNQQRNEWATSGSPMQNTFVSQLKPCEKLNVRRELSESPMSHPCKSKLSTHWTHAKNEIDANWYSAGKWVGHQWVTLQHSKTVNNKVSDGLVITREMSGSPVGHPCKHWAVKLWKTCEKYVCLARNWVGHQWVTHATIEMLNLLHTFKKMLHQEIEWVTSGSPMQN